MTKEPTQYKSPCKACKHVHFNSLNQGMSCGSYSNEYGSIQLMPQSSTDFGNMWNNNKYFNYSINKQCSCFLYVPSDNLEFLEWCYDNSQSKVQQP